MDATLSSGASASGVAHLSPPGETFVRSRLTVCRSVAPFYCNSEAVSLESAARPVVLVFGAELNELTLAIELRCPKID